MDEQQIKNKIREIITEEYTPILKEEETESKKPAYFFPVNKIRKATMTKKLSYCCGYTSIHIPRDITSSMKLEKGMMVQLSIELIESELDGMENIPTMFLNKYGMITKNEENPENSRNNPQN